MNLEYLLLDLDQTIYPAASKVFPEISRRMTSYVAGFYKVTSETARKWRESWARKHGTTLSGMIKERGFDRAEEFSLSVHPENIAELLDPDPEIRETLEKINLPMAVFTNSIQEHAKRVLEFYGITHIFEHIFDLRSFNFLGKPNISSYKRILAILNQKPEEVLFADDYEPYLLPFREMGGHVVLVRRNGPSSAGPLPSIGSIKELPLFIQRNFSRGN